MTYKQTIARRIRNIRSPRARIRAMNRVRRNTMLNKIRSRRRLQNILRSRIKHPKYGRR